MTRMRFGWDEAKDASNRRKHDGISFAVAARVFFDPPSITTQDQVVDGELRWRTVGTVGGAKRLDRSDPYHLGATGHTNGAEAI